MRRNISNTDQVMHANLDGKVGPTCLEVLNWSTTVWVHDLTCNQRNEEMGNLVG